MSRFQNYLIVNHLFRVKLQGSCYFSKCKGHVFILRFREIVKRRSIFGDCVHCTPSCYFVLFENNKSTEKNTEIKHKMKLECLFNYRSRNLTGHGYFK
jgi:hypothetical protein